MIADVEEMCAKLLASVLLTKWSTSLAINREVEAAFTEQDVTLLETRIRNLTRYQGFNTPSYLK